MLDDPAYLNDHRDKRALYDQLDIDSYQGGSGQFATLIQTSTRKYEGVSEEALSTALALVTGLNAA